ncbi:uncharacterized protein LOC130813983 [Amaranthus tricolor]|uniref:uncharacterized protein LOC130813983 n=1 Tax=Amaranthus tricolor TaxID=29722 RepID=UPI00258C90F0|nr:uncharacterized protein LOC130813983 [Amaranthus tricolor]
MMPFNFYFALILFLLISPSFSLSNSSSLFIPNFRSAIMPGKRNFSDFSFSESQSSIMAGNSNNKKLRRLPHIFSKVLELPLNSDADVSVQELPDCFKFIAEIEDSEIVNGGVRAHVVKYYPGITKIVIRRRENLSQPIIDELELDVWRFRLPSSARPERATAVYAHGKLVVTVPKNRWREDGRNGGDCKGGLKGDIENLVLVQ